MKNIITSDELRAGYRIENSVAMEDPPGWSEHCERCEGTGKRRGTREELYAVIRKYFCGNPRLADTEAQRYAKKEILEWREDGKIFCECQEEI